MSDGGVFGIARADDYIQKEYTQHIHSQPSIQMWKRQNADLFVNRGMLIVARNADWQYITLNSFSMPPPRRNAEFRVNR